MSMLQILKLLSTPKVTQIRNAADAEKEECVIPAQEEIVVTDIPFLFGNTDSPRKDNQGACLTSRSDIGDRRACTFSS